MRLLALVFAASLILGGCAPARGAAPGPYDTEVVKLTSSTGEHGSGVVVLGPAGNNVIITAKHVVSDAALKVETVDGTEYTARVLSLPPGIDFAVLSTSLPADAPRAHLACREPVTNEPIVVTGNPHFLSFVTRHGYVASPIAVEGQTILDITVLPGDSGAPVFDAHGDVIGIVAGVVTYPTLPQHLLKSVTGFATMTPIAALCAALPLLPRN